MKTHTYRLRARYSEVDAMGRVHNSRYLVYFEEARTDFVRVLGYTYAQVEEQGVIMPISDARLKYSRPISYDEEITVEVHLGYLKNYSLKFVYTIRGEDGEVACTGHTVHAAVDAAAGDFVEFPADLRELLAPFVAEK